MTPNPQTAEALEWYHRFDQALCDGYFVDIRYIASEGPQGLSLLEAVILLNPLPHDSDYNLSLQVPGFHAGQLQSAGVAKAAVLEVIANALNGSVTSGSHTYSLPKDRSYTIREGPLDQGGWFTPLSVQVFGAASDTLPNRKKIDDALRRTVPPFDGVEDVGAWLGLKPPDGSTLSTITIVSNPPVDLRTDMSALSDGKLRLILHGLPAVDRSQLTVAVRTVPGGGLKGRVQLTEAIVWDEVKDGRISGRLEVTLPEATGVLAMLLIGDSTIRRNWFVDPTKSPNVRYAAVQRFDIGLRMVRQGLFEATESHRFEGAVSALLFLLGFASTVQLEKDSPDLIVVTPLGKVLLIECTTRVADVFAKVGKLVDRRGALEQAMSDARVQGEVSTALVCRLPRNQIAAQNEIRKAGVLLVSREDLEEGLTRALLPANPDQIVEEAKRSLRS